MGQIIVVGLNPSGKVPAALFDVNFGVGRQDVGSIPRYLLCVGNKLSSGSMVADVDVVDITPSSDINALMGDRSELAQMVRVAQQYPGIQIKAAATAEAGGAAAATATITFVGTATSGGTFTYILAGVTVSFQVASGDVIGTIATNCATAFNNANAGRLPVTAAASLGVVTLTTASKGLRHCDWTLYQDVSLAPGTTTSALASASAYSVNPGKGGVTGVRLGGGTGTDSVANLLLVLANTTYYTIAWGQTDTTNAGLIKTWNLAQAAIGSQRYQSMISGQIGLIATAKTLAQTTVNSPDWSFPWMQGCEVIGGVLAASFGADATQKEQLNPNLRLNGDVLLGIPPARSALDIPSGGESGTQNIALGESITPINTTSDGNAIVVRAVTGLSLRNSVAFTGCLDRGQWRTAVTAAEELLLAWYSEFSVNNPWAGPNPGTGQRNPPDGKAYPDLWKSYAQGLLEAKIADNWFESVSVDAQWDPAAKQLLTTINLNVTAQNHRIAGNINQTF